MHSCYFKEHHMKRVIFPLLLSVTPLVLFSCGWFTSYPEFDGKNAFISLEKQCSFGPRNPGSAGHKACLDYLTDELKKYCELVKHQTFTYRDKKDTSVVLNGTNIIASINLKPKNQKRVMLCAHWDSRPWADRDPVEANRAKPILGANDGASGVAVLLELARIMHHQPPDIGVDIVLFDIEDYGDHGHESKPDSLNPYCVGSDYFAKNNQNYWPAYSILLDMVGDRQLDLPIEGHSYQRAKDVVNKVWDKAKDIDKKSFRKSVEDYIIDDHIPLQLIGIPSIVIIDFNYPDDRHGYWHTLQDTPDKCSPESLKEVGDVIVRVLYDE